MKNYNCVVTGASSGIGYEVVLSLLQEGHQVFAVSRNTGLLDALFTASGNSKRLHLVAGDLGSEEGLKNITGIIASGVNSVEILINNAGLLIRGTFNALSYEDWVRSYSVNVFGAAGMVRELLPLLRRGNLSDKVAEVKSHVVNISSMGGVQGSRKFPGLSAYSSSKASLVGLSECLAEEFVQEGISVNCLALGSVETEMFQRAFPGMKAGATASAMGRYVAGFGLEGWKFYNGKVVEVSRSTP